MEKKEYKKPEIKIEKKDSTTMPKMTRADGRWCC